MMTHRWADAAHTRVDRSDGAAIPADLRNADYAALIADGVEISPFRRWASMEEARAALSAEAERRASALRVLVAGTNDATKLAVYQRKYDVALGALAGEVTAIAALTPEAQARGQTVAALASLVKSLGDAWADAGLAIDAACQAHKAAIAALASLEAAEAYDSNAGWPQ